MRVGPFVGRAALPARRTIARGPQRLRQFGPGTEDARLDGPFLHPEDVCRFAVVVAQEIAEDNGEAEALVQQEQCVTQGGGQAVRCRVQPVLTSAHQPPAPAGTAILQDPAHAWGELIKVSKLPHGFVGLLVAAEVAAFMGALSSLINWGGSFVVNDLIPVRFGGARDKIWVSRLTTLALFLFAATVTILFVDNMVSWFLFINSAMVIFLLPLSWFRFFWWRFNVWGELAAVILGLPLSIIVWFVLDFQSKPMWQGLGLLFGLSFLVLVIATLATPPESKETLKRFYARCRPPGFWKPISNEVPLPDNGEPTAGRMFADCMLGIVASLGLVLATNAVFVGDWVRFAVSLVVCMSTGVWLLRRILEKQPAKSTPAGAVEVAK